MGIRVDGGIVVRTENDDDSVKGTKNTTEASPKTTVVPYRPSQGAQVELCMRLAELPVLGSVGVMHHWLRTPNKELGVGQTDGQIPGHGEPPPVGLLTKWVDHSKETEKTCAAVADVDVACVDRELVAGKSTGPWIPLVNDCHVITRAVLDKCSTKPKPDFGDPRETGAGHSL